MKRFLLLFISFLPVFTFAQSSLKNIRQKSWQTFVYRINASDAAQFIQWDSIATDRFIDATPALIVATDSFDQDQLSPGNYILLRTIGSTIHAKLACITHLRILTINNLQQLQIDVRTKDGVFVKDATVFVNNKAATYHVQSATWWVKNKNKEGAVVEVCTAGDTLFTVLTKKDDFRQTLSAQRKYNYQHSRIFKVLNWLPAAIHSIFTTDTKRHDRIGASGYIIFNQPKYKPLDTVKFKGYVVDKKWKQYKKPVVVYLNYRDRDKYVERQLATVSATEIGSYIAQFVLADSIPTGINCFIIFKTASHKEILREHFKVEDYLLDEVENYTFKSNKETYFKNDTLHFFAAAKDANGLPVMDGTARLLLTTEKINKFYGDSLFVADTIYRTESKLLADGDTKFAVPAGLLPAADVTVNAKLDFKNSNNELHEEQITVAYKYLSREIIVTQEADSIKAVYVENGIPTAKNGEVEMDFDTAVALQYPCTIKIDPLAESYTFYTKEKEQHNVLVNDIDIEKRYLLSLTRISSGDTLGFILNNPFKIPVYFTVFNGKKMVASGKQATALVTWQKPMHKERQAYKVRWQYIWAGRENYGEETIGLLYKLLDIKINANPTVFPGQQDVISIDVKDYKGHAAAGVNLTVVSYNNQFSKDIRVPQPPYLATYKKRQYLQREGFEAADDMLTGKDYLLGKNTSWIQKFHLDTMVYYKLLFPPTGYFDAVTLLDKFIPEVSVNAVKNGVPQEIYLLYINRELVYYNGVTDSMKYAYPVYPGYAQVGIRLKDKYIEIDSIYIQPDYKHDISFDINHLPPHATVTPVTNCWTTPEMDLIEHSVWQMKNNYQNNNAFIWQDERVVKLAGNRDHVAGPFRQAAMQFYNPGAFDIACTFEPGYQYDLSKQIMRLEKMPLFFNRKLKHFLPEHAAFKMILGDTLVAAPLIRYLPVKKDDFTKLINDDWQYTYADKVPGKASLQFDAPKDSVLQYVLLMAVNDTVKPLVLRYCQNIRNLLPGEYDIFLVTSNFYVAATGPILLTGDGTDCIAATTAKFNAANYRVDQLLKTAAKAVEEKKDPPIVNTAPEEIYQAPDNAIYAIVNGAAVTGTVVDNKGKNPVPFATIKVKGYNKMAATDATGNFVLNNLKPGRYVLIFSGVGYEAVETAITCGANDNIKLHVVLKVSSRALNEVVVIGYGMVTKRQLTGSMSMVKGEELYLLSGKAAGVSLNASSGADITIRGIGTTASSDVLYVIDGILYDVPPKNFNLQQAVSVTVLQGDAATALYGERAINGVVVITTSTKTLRSKFRDYAFWQPELVTDQKGHVSFEADYPDNITAWKTFVVAMDKKRRIGKAFVLTQAYKPILAQLSVPRFLIMGDSAIAIAKSINYTADKYEIATRFSIDRQPASVQQQLLLPNDAVITEAVVAAAGADTITTSFSLKSTTGFKDGEERKIPVYQKGTAEAIGNFWVLKNDTSFSCSALAGTPAIHLYAQNNTLDMLLDELDNLKKYPYFCMEQTASKLTGFAMEKKIRAQLGQPFNDQQAMDKLLQKIVKAQLFTGGWAWWENGKANFYITNYIAYTLLQFRENPLVAAAIPNAFLYLQNQLPFLNRGELVTALATLSEGGHEMDYTQWINKIPFDSLSQHQQWLWVKIKQQLKMDHGTELKKLVAEKVATSTGGLHWGVENYNWYSDETATTLVAYNVIMNEAGISNLCPLIIQYFLEKRRSGHWSNTVQAAGIISTLLPAMIAQQSNFNTPAAITITGDTNFVIDHFPYQGSLDATRVKQVNIRKSGGGLVYFTAWQNLFNNTPAPVTDKFVVSTSFKRNNQSAAIIKAGEKTTMVVTVNVLKDAEYVMIQVPIPAGCTYTEKENSDWKLYRQLYKDRVLLFAEALAKGVHQFEIGLEPRYKGTYTLNPAVASLMYYPTFFGRNGLRKVSIVQ